jgi:hypothetical protein
MASMAPGGRRNTPVDLPAGSGIPSISVTNQQAPGLPGVAVLPPPVPDMSAARDLEQALRATQALGNTLVDVGNAINIQRQIDERQSVYNARIEADRAQGQMLLDFQNGKMNDAIDATVDMDAFIASYADRYLDPARTEPPKDGDRLTAAEAEYRERIGRTARELYVTRHAQRQKEQFQDDIRGVHAGLVDPATVGPNPDVATLWDEFSTRYPWLDRATFMEASFGKAMEALAKAGDEQGFRQVADLVTDDQDRVIYVGPLEKTMRDAVQSRISRQLEAASVAVKAASESTDPFVSRYSQLRDRLQTLVEDDGAREDAMVDFFSKEISQTRSMGDLEATEATAKMALSPDAYQAYTSRKAALQGPVITKMVKAASSVPGSNFVELATDADGLIDPDDLEAAKDAWVRTTKQNRRNLMVTEYARTGEREKIEKLLDDSLASFDMAKPAWLQVGDAIDGEEWLDLRAELDKVDAAKKAESVTEDVLARRVILAPGAPAWDDVMARTSAVRGGKIVDPVAAANVVAQTQTVPSKLLDAMFADLRGTKADKERGLRFLAGIAPLLDNPDSAAQINGFSLSQTDSSTNAASILAIQSMMPMLAQIDRGPDGSISDEAIAPVAQTFEAALERWQDAQPPLYDAKRFEDQLRGANVSKVMGVVATDSQTNTVTVTSFRNALKTAAADAMSKQGMDVSAAAELGDIASARVLRDIVPAIGNAGLSREVIEQRVRGEIEALKAEYHLPMLAGRGFPAPVDRAVAPNATWDEPTIVGRLAEQGIKPESVTHVLPAMGEGNTWWLLVSEDKVDRRTKKTVTSKRFVQVDIPLPQQEVPEATLPIEERVRRARERGRQQRSTIPPIKDLRNSGVLPFTLNP